MGTDLRQSHPVTQFTLRDATLLRKIIGTNLSCFHKDARCIFGFCWVALKHSNRPGKFGVLRTLLPHTKHNRKKREEGPSRAPVEELRVGSVCVIVMRTDAPDHVTHRLALHHRHPATTPPLITSPTRHQQNVTVGPPCGCKARQSMRTQWRREGKAPFKPHLALWYQNVAKVHSTIQTFDAKCHLFEPCVFTCWTLIEARGPKPFGTQEHC